jgi:hypothetical protein
MTVAIMEASLEVLYGSTSCLTLDNLDMAEVWQ